MITGSDTLKWDRFGSEVCLSGDYAIVSSNKRHSGDSYGAVYIFARNKGGAGNWGEAGKLLPSGIFISLGYSISISGDYAVATARDGIDHLNKIYIFARNHGGTDNWGEVKKIDPLVDKYTPLRVCIEGDYLIAGSAFSNNEYGKDAGTVRIFGRSKGGNDNWGEIKRLVPSNAAPYDWFGEAVSISSDYAVVGSPRDDDRKKGCGSVYIFCRNHGGLDNWGEFKRLTATDQVAGGYLGSDVSISGDYIIAGSAKPFRDGSAYIFARNQCGADNWGQVAKIVPSNINPGERRFFRFHFQRIRYSRII